MYHICIHMDKLIVRDKSYDDIIGLSTVPEEINISTLSLTCKVQTKINVINILKFFDLENNITMPMEKIFRNQMSLIIQSNNDGNLNIKLFKNGSIQITGCKSIEHLFTTLEYIFTKLRCYSIVCINNKIVRKYYVKDLNNLDVNKLSEFKITLINSDFKVGFKINRQILFKIIKDNYKHIHCEYDPDRHAGVRIYYSYNNNPKCTAIFVFESGSIVITGGLNKTDIIESFNCIVKILYDNFKQIVKIDIKTFLERQDIINLIDSY